jgi:hypothetical protein
MEPELAAPGPPAAPLAGPIAGKAAEVVVREHASRAVESAAPDYAATVGEWLKNLPKGSIQYRIYDSGGSMVLNQQYAATATIYPPGQTPPAAADSTTASGQPAAGPGKLAPQVATNAVSVASWMRVDLVQTDNLGTFKIEPEQGACVLVLSDRPTAWTFTVTPLVSGNPKILKFTAYAAYGQDEKACSPDNPTIFPLPSGDPQMVNVKDFSVKIYEHHFWDSFFEDPWSYIKPWLPGGTALAAVSGAFAWWRKRRAAGSGSPPANRTLSIGNGG